MPTREDSGESMGLEIRCQFRNIYMCVCVSNHYIERERERKKHTDIFVLISASVHSASALSGRVVLSLERPCCAQVRASIETA